MAPRATALLLALLVAACGIACGGSAREATGPEVAVRVQGLALDRSTGTPVLILAEVGGERRLPIWIGTAAAHSIAAELAAGPPSRPNAHDLALRLLDRLHGKIDRVVVTALRDGVYYAELRIEAGGREVAVDARPSDAIAIALRAHADVYVREPVFAAAALFEHPPTAPPKGGRRSAPHRQHGVLSL